MTIDTTLRASRYSRSIQGGVMSGTRSAARFALAWALIPLVSVAGGSKEGAGCGNRWTVVKSPSDPAPTTLLRGVAAVAPGDVWAAGFSIKLDGQVKPVTLHWDGLAWTIVRPPDPPSS